MKIFFILFLLLSFLSCCNEPPLENYDVRPDVKLVNELSIKVAQKLQEKYGLIACGTGSQMMDKIKMIALSFNYYKPVDIEKARELLLAATNEMVVAVNEDVKIHPYLHEFPFGPNNVEIRIFAYKEDGSDFPKENLSIFSEINGNLAYKTFDHEKSVRSVTIHKETHQQALQRQSLLQSLKKLDSK
jgi:hypothetical protein